MKLAIVCTTLLLATCAYASFEHDSDIWVENEKVESDEMGAPKETSCEAVATSLDMFGALSFVSNSKSGPFSCEQAWDQELASSSVWLRGKLGKDEKDMVIHVGKRAKRAHQDGDSNEGGSGRVHEHEKKFGLDGKVKRVSPYNKLKNKYELLGAFEPQAAEVPEMIKAGREELSQDDQPEVALGWIQESEAERKAYGVQKYEAKAEFLAQAPGSYNFETQYPDCAAIKIVNQGGCGSCWAFASAKAYSMSLYHQSRGQYNINLAEQDLLSCTPSGGSFYLRNGKFGKEVVEPTLGAVRNGCEGGNAVGAWGPMQSSSRVTRTCDPYTGYAGIMTQRIQNEGGSVDSCGSHLSMCSRSGQKDLEYGVEKIFQMEGSDINGIKSAIMELGPVYVGVSWDDGLSNFKGSVYTRPVGNIKGGHAMAIVGWGQDYWIIANSHGINNNDKGHIKWGFHSSNPIKSVYAVQVKLPNKCQSSAKCMNGGAFEDDCQCRCVPPYSGSTCNSCSLSCQNGGTRVSGKCACSCPSGYFGDDCSNYILAEFVEADAWNAKVAIKWNLKEFHSGSNFIYRTVEPNGKGGCDNCPKLAQITSKKGSATGTLSFGSGFGGRPFGEQCHTAKLSLGTNEFGASKGFLETHLPCLKLSTRVNNRAGITGQSKQCLCGGTEPTPGSFGYQKQCPASSYKADCCPESTAECAGRTGR
jgi:cathepsin B